MDSPGSDERYSDYFQLDVDQENVDSNALHGLHRYQHHQHPHKRHQLPPQHHQHHHNHQQEPEEGEEQRQRSSYHQTLSSCQHQDEEEFPPCAYMYTSYPDNRYRRRDEISGTPGRPSCGSGESEFVRLPEHAPCMRLSDHPVSEVRVSDPSSSAGLSDHQAVVLSDQAPPSTGLAEHPSSVRLSYQPSSFRMSDRPPALALSDQTSSFRLADQSDGTSSFRLSDQPDPPSSIIRLSDPPSSSMMSAQSSTAMCTVPAAVTSFSGHGDCVHKEMVGRDQSYSYHSHHSLRQYGSVQHNVGPPLQVADMGNSQVRRNV